MSSEIITFLLGATPVGEARVAIPWGMTFGGLLPAEAFFWGVLGNICAIVAITFLLKPIADFARKNSKILDHFFIKLFKKTRKEHSKRFERFEELLIILLVAIPLPGSGGYTGVLVAWLFGIRKRISIMLISLGVVISGLVTLGLTTGAITLAKLF